MSKFINIPSTVKDPAYRYTMPVMRLSQESRLNGVKMNITNLTDVALAIRVPASAILKYFCAELGCNSEGTQIIKGQHNVGDLTRHLDKFIGKYVLCSKCKYPELSHTIVKKDLIGTCNACGTSKKLDNIHKAGKQLIKDLPNFISENAIGTHAQQKPGTAASGAPDGGKKTGGKKKRQPQAAASAEEVPAEGGAAAEGGEKPKKKKKAAQEPTEISGLDSIVLDLTSEPIEKAIQDVTTWVAEHEEEFKGDELLQEMRQTQLVLNITSDYKYYILICGIFGPHRNIVKKWTTFEEVFVKLSAQDAEEGPKRLFQAIIQFFINKYPEQQKFAATMCNLLYEQCIFADEFFVKWFNRKMSLDKQCILYDRAAEKAFRGLIGDFITYLTENAAEEEEGYYDEEEPAAEEEGKVEETEDQRKQREIIEQQMRAQEEAAVKALAAAEERKKEQAEEAAKKAAQESAELDSVAKTNAANIEVEEDFDVDDI